MKFYVIVDHGRSSADPLPFMVVRDGGAGDRYVMARCAYWAPANQIAEALGAVEEGL